MKTLLLFLTAVFCGVTSNAQNLKITFKGSGASSSIATVQIQNLKRGTSLTVKGEDTLQLLTTVTGIGPTGNYNSSAVTIYPNPTIENSYLEFTPPVPGNAVIRISDLTGRQIAVYESYLSNIKQKFVLSCIGNGTYLVSVSGRKYNFSGQLISVGYNSGTSSISKVNELSVPQVKIPDAESRSIKDDTTALDYSPGEKLKFTAKSGKFSTVVVDSPDKDKTIEFEFVACTDGDNNNYPVVRIGEQVWMAENLKTTRYRDGSGIPYNDKSIIGAIEQAYPAYSWYNNDSIYRNIYGGLYTLETLRTNKLCPAGWHAWMHSEMDTLISFLGGKFAGGGYGGRSEAGGKLKETGTIHWKSPNADASNESGFSALPGGIRDENGTFRGIGEYAGFMSVNVCDGDATWGCMYELHYNDGIITGDEHIGTFSTSVRCVYGGGPQILSTWIDTASVDLTTATAGGEIDKMETVTERGLCWSTGYYPTINDSHVTAGSGTGRFSGKITGLNQGSLYWLRAYAKNETGTSYGNVVSFTTGIRDINENVYKTVLINSVFEGWQIWMASNLRATSLNDNTRLPELSSGADWKNTNAPAYCSYENKKDEEYGLLYNWFSVETGKLCPEGWKVADTTEYRLNVGRGHNLDMKILVPGGLRDSEGVFSEKGKAGYFWFGTGEQNGSQAWSWTYNSETGKTRLVPYSKKSGLSVRCFWKAIPENTTSGVLR